MPLSTDVRRRARVSREQILYSTNVTNRSEMYIYLYMYYCTDCQNVHKSAHVIRLLLSPLVPPRVYR
jgi:hypothetical protein